MGVEVQFYLIFIGKITSNKSKLQYRKNKNPGINPGPDSHLLIVLHDTLPRFRIDLKF